MPKLMATTSKAQYLTEVQALLKERYPLEPGPEKLAILEAVVYAICHEDATRSAAAQALARFKDRFFDWNEVRVSSIEEIRESLQGLDQPEARAVGVRRFLRQLFEKTYGFNLDALLKKPQKESVKALEEYEALGSDYIMATVTRLALGGHAIPVDAAAARALGRLGVAEGEADAAALRPVLERAVPKNRGCRVRRPDRGAGPRHLRRGRAGLPPLRPPGRLPDRPGAEGQPARGEGGGQGQGRSRQNIRISEIIKFDLAFPLRRIQRGGRPSPFDTPCRDGAQPLLI